MDEDIAQRVYSDPVARWFVTEAFRITDTGQLVAAAGEQLVLAGIPLYRLAYFQLTLHPQFQGTAWFWRRGRGVESGTRPHGDNQDSEYRDNPLPTVFEQQRIVRVRLDQVEPQAPLLQQLKAEGATDYVAIPLLFTNGHVDALSVVSDRTGGFSTTDLDRMYQLQFAFTRIVEIHSLRDTAANLLDAYVGRAAGQRILAGEVKRGDGQSIEAVIWYCDLRGFTALSDATPAEEVVRILDRYFDAMATPIDREAGEVLKFVGDAVLAIFPIGSDPPAAVCERALAATRDARRNIAAINRDRAARNEAPIGYGIAMHVGEVMYGNVGALHRLDFTVIGAPVNEACRVEALTRTLDVDVLLTDAFVAASGAKDFPSVGRHPLKGVSTLREVFALPGE